MLTECVFNTKMYQRTNFNFTINNQEGFAKNLANIWNYRKPLWMASNCW